MAVYMTFFYVRCLLRCALPVIHRKIERSAFKTRFADRARRLQHIHFPFLIRGPDHEKCPLAKKPDRLLVNNGKHSKLRFRNMCQKHV